METEELLSFNFTLSLFQSKLTDKLGDIQRQINNLSDRTVNIQERLNTSSMKLFEQAEIANQSIGTLKQKISEIQRRQNHALNIPKLEIMEKTPTEVLDDMEERISIPQNPAQKRNSISINYQPLNSDRICYNAKIKEQDNERQEKIDEKEQSKFKKDQKSEPSIFRHEEIKMPKDIDERFFDVYSRIMEMVEKEITNTRKDLKKQITEWKNESKKVLNELSFSHFGNKNKQAIQEDEESLKSEQNIELIESHHSIHDKESETLKNLQALKKKESNEQHQEHEDKKNKKLNKKQLEQTGYKKAYIDNMFEELKNKIQEIGRSNSIIADHMVHCKKNVEDVGNVTDSLKIEVNGMRENHYTTERQVSLLVEASNDHKNRIKEIEGVIGKINEAIEIIEKREMDAMKQQEDDDQKGNKNDIFRDSKSSFRSSVNGGGGQLGPIRPSSIVKQNNNRLDSIQQSIKKISNKLTVFIDRVNKMEDEKKKFGDFQSSILPKIDKENRSNINHFQIIKKDIKKINEDISRANDKINLTKQRLNQLYSSHQDIPNQISDLYGKLRQYNEIQEDRLIELIKELINRALIDPFDNNFTNTLKREINVKFLEIKHEYNSILKQITNKLDGRAQQTEVVKIQQALEEEILQIKSLLLKKCDIDDFKKGIRYVETKVKDVYQFAKNETVNLYNEQKKYIGGRKT